MCDHSDFIGNLDEMIRLQHDYPCLSIPALDIGYAIVALSFFCNIYFLFKDAFK